MRPISVSIAVAVTTISPRPRVTVVFMYAMSWRSPSGTSSRSIASIDFVEGSLSPVSAACSISSVFAASSRPSAGIRSPASNSTTSPGTSASASRFTSFAVAAGSGVRDEHRAQRREGVFGPVLLHEADHRVQQHDDEHDDGGLQLARHGEGHHRGGDQDEDEQIGELGEESSPCRHPHGLGERVRPVPGGAGGHLGGGEAVGDIDAEALGDCLRLEAMGRLAGWCDGLWGDHARGAPSVGHDCRTEGLSHPLLRAARNGGPSKPDTDISCTHEGRRRPDDFEAEGYSPSPADATESAGGWQRVGSRRRGSARPASR